MTVPLAQWYKDSFNSTAVHPEKLNFKRTLKTE